MININKPKLTLLFFSILLGVFMAGQMKQNLPSIAPATLRSIQATRNEIDSVSTEMEDINKVIAEKQEQLRILENISSGDDNIIDILAAEYEKNKIVAGFEEVEGSGIVIKMEDSIIEGAFGEEYDLDVIHDADVLRVINDLRVAGAEAISINGQRVLSISEIKCGGPIIRVNGKSLGAPFYIKAIGDPKLLNASINAPSAYSHAVLKNIYNIGLETTIEDKIVIPAYNGRFNFRYAEPLKEGD